MGLLVGIETGGTKTVCAVAEDPAAPQQRVRVATSQNPLDTLAPIARFVSDQCRARGTVPLAVGIGSFGPCDPDPSSPTYGHVLATPKPGWRDTDVVGLLRAQLSGYGLDLPAVAFDTDVTAAAVGEQRLGAGRDVDSLVYVTVGTGIGGGAVLSGRPVHGLLHPEMGHVLIPRPAAELAAFPGVCPFHGDCWEGVAAGPAMAQRWGHPAESLDADHEAWDLAARYIAAGLHAIVCTLSPQRIVLGGGVGTADGLLARVRPQLRRSLAGYVDRPALTDAIDGYVVAPGLGSDSGVIGALCLAAAAAAR